MTVIGKPVNRRRLIDIASIAVVIAGLVAIIILRSPAQTELECYVGQTQNMTVQQVANVLNTPLVELTWFPGDLEIKPVVTTFPTYIAGNSQLARCQLTIDYPRPESSTHENLVSLWLTDLNSIQPTKVPTSCSWRFGPDGPMGTNCSVEVDGSDSTLRVNFTMSSVVSPEDALQILDGIQVIDPQE